MFGSPRDPQTSSSTAPAVASASSRLCHATASDESVGKSTAERRTTPFRWRDRGRSMARGVGLGHVRRYGRRLAGHPPRLIRANTAARDANALPTAGCFDSQSQLAINAINPDEAALW